MNIILSSGLAISGLSYAGTNPDTNPPQNAGNTPGTTQTNGAQTPNTVQNQGMQTVPDEQLKPLLDSALKDYTGKVQIQVINGVVSLSGQLESDTDYEKAITLVKSVKGVYDVNADNLTVKDSTHPLKDTYITAKVKGSLIQKDLFDTDIPSWSIGVETKDGKVFLSGKATTDVEKQQILQVVQSVNGVTAVDDQIVVTAEPASGAVNGAQQPAPSNGTQQQGQSTSPSSY